MKYLYTLLTSKSTKDYELIDVGDGAKLERFGSTIFLRPDPQALFTRAGDERWNKPDAIYLPGKNGGSWRFGKEIPDDISITLEGVTFGLKLSSFKHTGVFPEQMSNWAWLREMVNKSKDQLSVLNLFGYTGGASIALAQAGAKVTHVDSSRGAITSASVNASLSGLSSTAIRWMREDVRAFVSRELRRGNTYDAIVMDPPVFGHGAKGESWHVETDMVPLLRDIEKLLSPKASFLLLNGYASGFTSLAYGELLSEIQAKHSGVVERGELAIEATSGRVLPAGIFARWSK